MIALYPPNDGSAPFRKFTLGSGKTYFPDFDNGGRVNVSDPDDVNELLTEGWLSQKPRR
jgi:hypothetical protein